MRYSGYARVFKDPTNVLTRESALIHLSGSERAHSRYNGSKEVASFASPLSLLPPSKVCQIKEREIMLGVKLPAATAKQAPALQEVVGVGFNFKSLSEFCYYLTIHSLY